MRELYGRDWDKILAEWARGGPMNVTAEDGWAALGALERLRPAYLTEFHATQLRANFTLSQLIAQGMDLLACESLPGLRRIIKRIEKADRGAEAELRVAAFFRRLNLPLTLEPWLDGKKPDLAIDGETGRTYVEVISPGWPAPLTELVELLHEAADVLAGLVHIGEHLQVAFLDDPTPPTVGVVATAIQSLQPSQTVRQIENAALVRLTPFGEETQGVELSDRPVYGVARLQTTAESGYNVNVKAAFSDERAERLLEQERPHFQQGQPNMVVMDLSQVADGIKAWTPLLKKSLESKQNAILSAVLLCSVHFNLVLAPGVLEGTVIENPKAAVPINRELLDRLVSGLLTP
jgi:hypothetical protein